MTASSDGRRGVGLRSRAVLIVDRYALVDLVRGLRLRPTDGFVMLGIMTLVDHRTHEWSGTLGELGAQASLRAASVRGVVDRLVDVGLIEEVEPFGHNRSGTLRLLAYGALIAPGLSSPMCPELMEAILTKARESGPTNRAAIERGTNVNRAAIERNRAFDQPEQASRKEQVNKEQAKPPLRSATRCKSTTLTEHERWLERPFTEEFDDEPEPPLTADEAEWEIKVGGDHKICVNDADRRNFDSAPSREPPDAAFTQLEHQVQLVCAAFQGTTSVVDFAGPRSKTVVVSTHRLRWRTFEGHGPRPPCSFPGCRRFDTMRGADERPVCRPHRLAMQP